MDKMDTGKLEKKVLEYVKTFNECVPVFMMPSMSADELIKVIDDHIKAGKPIVPDVPDDPTIVY